MKNQMLFVIILCGLLNSSSLLASGKEQSTSILDRFLRPPLPTPPQLSQRQLQQIEQQIQQQKQQAELEAIQKKAKETSAADSLLAHFSCLSEHQKSRNSIQFNELRSDGSLEKSDRPETISSPKNELFLYPTKVDFSPKNNDPCPVIRKLTRKNTDTFVMETCEQLPYLLPEQHVKTLIDLFKAVPDCFIVDMTISLSNDEDDATPALSEKTFSITPSALDDVNQTLLIFTPSDPDTIAHFSEQFELQKAHEKKSPPPSPEVCTESDEQKQNRLAKKKAAREAQELLGQQIADDTTQQSTTIEPIPSVQPTSFSLYRSSLFLGCACTIVALAIAAFYYPHTGHFLELCKNFFTNSASENIVLPTEPAHIEVNVEANS